MKRNLWLPVLAALGLAACSPSPKVAFSQGPVLENTLLWRVSGNGLTKPSYLFGTMHMICANDIQVSDSLQKAIQNADKVYLEINMNDLEDISTMFGAFTHMTMRNDTTLADLLSPSEYKKVKAYFEDHNGLLPFSMMEKFKPMIIESMMMDQSSDCDNTIIMEQLVMEEAKKSNVDIDGLETMDYQLSIFDTIPYKLQAKQLVKMAEGKDNNNSKEMAELTNAYREQRLNEMDELIQEEDSGIKDFANLLLYNRNTNWANKLQQLMSHQSLVVAVGAGHLPGDKGVINLLRKAGYKVEPVKNDMIKKKSKEI